MVMNATRTGLLLSVMLASVLVTSTACSDSDEGSVTGGDGPASDAATSPEGEGLPTQGPATGASERREEFVNILQAQIDKVDLRIDEMKSEAESLSGDTKEEAVARIDALSERVAGLEDRLAEVESAGAAELEALKRDIEAEIADMQTEADRLADELGA